LPEPVSTPTECFPPPPAPAAAGKRWQVAYSEEFDGNRLDLTKLSPCFDWNYGECTSSFNNGRETYLPSQVRISGGTAKLVAEPLARPEPSDNCFQGECTYKAGLVSTARPRADDGSDYLFSFTYGYIESRMKYSNEPGFFTAFWMLPTDPSYEYEHEIDIVEILGGYPETIFMHYHYDNRQSSFRVGEPPGGIDTNGECPVRDYSQDWVRFGLDWQPSHIAWYINGIKCGEYTGPDIVAEPMQFILHMMVDNDWERDWGSVLSSPDLVDQLEVDYIRVYQQE
jgi:hypothetical protein